MREEHKETLKKLLEIANSYDSRDFKWYIILLIYYFIYYVKVAEKGCSKEGYVEAGKLPTPFDSLSHCELQFLADRTIEVLNENIQQQEVFDDFREAINILFFGR